MPNTSHFFVCRIEKSLLYNLGPHSQSVIWIHLSKTKLSEKMKIWVFVRVSHLTKFTLFASYISFSGQNLAFFERHLEV